MSVAFRGVVSGFRLPGTVGTPLNVMTAKNTAGSGLYIAIFEWSLFKDMTAAAATITPMATVTAATGTEAGGAAMTKTNTDGALNTPSANSIFRQGASADGTAAAITGLTAGTTILWRTQPMKMVTLAGPAINPTPDVIPVTARTKPWIIAPGGNLLLQIVGAGLTTDSYYPGAYFEEWTTSTG